MKLFILLVVMLAVVGCEGKTSWVPRRVPVTEDHRKAVAEHAIKILSKTPWILAGNDQDWDDAIAQAHFQATQLFCPVTLWERVPDGHFMPIWSDTGRWRYATNE